MLPGFRFLFAAILLSMSVLVFGLGAAAVLRAAHEQFAESGSWRPAPDTSAAQQGEMVPPVLAMLRVEQPSAPKADAAPGTPPAQSTEVALPEAAKTAAVDSQAAPAPEIAKADTVAVAKTDIAKSDVAKSDVAKSGVTKPDFTKPEVAPDSPKAEGNEAPAVAAVTPATPETAHQDAPAMAQPAATVEVPAADTKAASAEPPPAPAAAAAAISPPAPADEPAAVSTTSSEAFPAVPDKPGAPAAGDPVAARIATLGGPPVVIEQPTPEKAVRAGPDPNEVKKDKDKERAEERARRRRLAAARRARQAREAAQAQQAANPFAPPNEGFQYVQPAQANANANARTR